MKKRTLTGILFGLWMMAPGGCEEARQSRSNDGGTEADAGGEGDTEYDTNCDGQSFPLGKTSPSLMILQDLSVSMDNGAPASKWVQTKQALIDTLKGLQAGQIVFGFDFFPRHQRGEGFCAVGNKSTIDSRPGTIQDIIGKLRTLVPAGGTPLLCAMENYTGDNYAPMFTNYPEEKYLLIVSDGKDTCGVDCEKTNSNPADATMLADAAKRLLDNQGIRTIVIGFGDEADPAQLNAIAAAGGTQFSTFIDAADQAELAGALEKIAGTLADCTWTLDSPDAAADPSKVNFFFDDEVVGYDAECAGDSGWRWKDGDPESLEVEFCGASCDAIRTQSVSEISATFGCKTVVV